MLMSQILETVLNKLGTKVQVQQSIRSGRTLIIVYTNPLFVFENSCFPIYLLKLAG